MEMIRTKLDALKKLAGNLGVDPAETARCVTINDALNLIAQHLGGETGARTNAEAIGNIAEVASAGGGGLTEYEKMLFESKKSYSPEEFMAGNIRTYDLVIPEEVEELPESAFSMSPLQFAPQIGAYGIPLGSVVLPDTITSIPTMCFYNQGLRSVTFGNSVESIGETAFCSCPIEELVFPPTLKTIGEGAFYGARISELTIPEGVTTIECGAFSSCLNLKVANLPSTLVTREFGENEQGIFTQCTALETVNINMPEGSIDVSDFFGLTPPTVNWLG
ncbi:MAG: leucine-rich repeat domain-containing protein [Oscillospiraceae bacterium]|nr:leucine-rich repeat domain-containing protein [Oscillospiraceae bacterium]